MGLGSNANQTPILHSLQVTQSVYGIVIPIGAGTFRVPGNLLWYGDFNANGTAYNNGGKGLGKGASQYDYTASILALLCGVPLSGIGNVWGQNGRLTLQNVSEIYTVPSGGGSYTVANAAAYNADQGVSVATPYSVVANDYGSPGPVTLTGTTQATLPIGATGYTATSGIYAFPSTSAAVGQTVTISYSFTLYTVGASEDYNLPNTSPYMITVTNQPNFYADGGVIFIDTGIPLTVVGGTPSTTGTYNPNGGDYLFAPVDALRPVVINYEWQQSQSSLNPSATLSFTLLEGAQNQAPWSYLTSLHLSQALGYSGLACIGAAAMDLGPSGQMENYNYECAGPYQFGGGIVDADLAVWILNFLQNTVWGVQFPGAIDSSLLTICRDYWNANSFFASPLLDSARAASGYLDDWCEAGNVGMFWSENSLKFIPYGDTTQVGNGFVFSPMTAPVVDLDDTDFLAEGSEDPVEIDRAPWQDAKNEVHVQFSNRLNNYDSDSVILQDDNAVGMYGLHPESQKDYSFLRTIPAANFAASVRLKRLVNIRRSFNFKVSGIRYCFLEPMDLVTITDVVTGLQKTPVRILEISEDEKRVYSIKAEEFPWGTATATIYPKQPTKLPPPLPMMAQPGNTSVLDIFEPPATVASTVANSLYQIWMALSGGPNWGGCLVMFSSDGNSYEQIGVQTGTSRAGVLTAPLPYAADPDSTDTLAVTTTGQLFNVTLAQANAFATLSKIGQEYIAYQDATLTASAGQTNSYGLTYLRRGVFSTPDLAHLAGEPFVRIDSQIFQYSFNPSLAGQIVYFKFLSFNLMNQMQQGLGDVPAVAFLVSGTNISQNMNILAVNSSGWELEIFQTGQPVGTAGSATLANGAILVLPATIITGLSASTTYYVNYDLATNAYVTYTNESAWLQDQAAGDFIGIGSAATLGGGGSTVYYPGSQIGSGVSGSYSYYAPRGQYKFSATGVNYYAFPNIAPSSVTLYVTAGASIYNDGASTMSGEIDVSFDGGTTWTTLVSYSATTAPAVHSIAVPGGTNLNLVQVRGRASGSPAYDSNPNASTVDVTLSAIEIY